MEKNTLRIFFTLRLATTLSTIRAIECGIGLVSGVNTVPSLHWNTFGRCCRNHRLSNSVSSASCSSSCLCLVSSLDFDYFLFVILVLVIVFYSFNIRAGDCSNLNLWCYAGTKIIYFCSYSLGILQIDCFVDVAPVHCSSLLMNV